MAVYTEVSDDELIEFMSGYDLGEVVAFKGIAEGIENSNFHLTMTGGAYILTLYERRVAPRDLPFFLDLLDHLAARGVPCPVPVRARDGKALRALAGRPAAVVTFLPGLWPRRVTPGHCAGVGRALARMHLAGADFVGRRDNALSVSAWRSLLKSAGPEVDCVQMGLAVKLGRDLDTIEAGWPKNLPEGIIHADLFPDNVFFRGDDLTGLIDFYFACRDFLAYDLAVCLNAWCFEADFSFNVTKARRLVGEYDRVRPLEAAEVAALPLLAKGAAMRFLLTRLYDWLNTPEGAFVTPKDPLEYVAKLRFHDRVASAAEYGLDVE
ncbi:MAG: homoserine kinase [Rhodospirillales bacterium CG15_BIG_FIL_POST_REV_8_21_14_020_66_15]|nr:MAG: homoserine kinase [Rhodospirillales bacterium CG15_BIG_FIL_POST_REV_8_21_14_020_66_15]